MSTSDSQILHVATILEVEKPVHLICRAGQAGQSIDRLHAFEPKFRKEPHCRQVVSRSTRPYSAQLPIRVFRRNCWKALRPPGCSLHECPTTRSKRIGRPSLHVEEGLSKLVHGTPTVIQQGVDIRLLHTLEKLFVHTVHNFEISSEFISWVLHADIDKPGFIDVVVAPMKWEQRNIVTEQYKITDRRWKSFEAGVRISPRSVSTSSKESNQGPQKPPTTRKMHEPTR